MKLISLLCLLIGTITCDYKGVRLVAMVGEDVVLPCSLSPETNIESAFFDWTKDRQEVFLYDAGIYQSEDPQFKGRVSHFPNKLKNGSASIIIRNIKLSDSGNYTCIFPRLQQQRFHVELLVAVINIQVKEDDDVILGCSFGTTNMENKRFDWKKDADKKTMDVFSYIEKRTDPGPQYKNRVFHFRDQLQFANASIKIKKAKTSDSGTYMCYYASVQKEIKSSISLTVVPIFKPRPEIEGAAPKPSVRNLHQSKNSALLQCEVLGASPKPEVVWTDSDGTTLPADEPKVTEREGNKYDVILDVTVTKTGHYTCVATQKEIYHQINDTTFAHFNDETSWGWIIGLIVAVIVAVIEVVFGVLCVRERIRLRSLMKEAQERREMMVALSSDEALRKPLEEV